MATTSPGPAIAASFRFLAPAWSKAYGPMSVQVAIIAGGRLARADAPNLALLWAALLLLLTLFFGTIQTGSLYRIGLQEDHKGDPRFRVGLAGFQWTQFEWRVLGASVLFATLVVGAVLFLLLVWAFALGVLIQGRQIDPNEITRAKGLEVLMRLWRSPAGPVSALILGPGFLAVFYIYARLLLLRIMAAETGDFGFGRALALTRGATLAIMLGVLVIGAAEFLLGAIAGAVGGAFWGGLAGVAIGRAYAAPATAGLVSYTYRLQRGDASGIAETFS